MNVGDLVEDDFGNLAIIIRQVGVIDRWVIQYIENGEKVARFESALFPIRS